ncbi:hypothetical protein IM792_13875 [Mucilaginibacter sp. JRF]|uniref:hypothetical protein n=1 Tax=Mucilaginibacter sp. JRF TaxID=2780088 RepID=UPI0018824237|nr:hypothetical protein [Mucilaginibacter sp. JRF]MBE9585539.1 hypothetical protein [Mucilaginibacter sp. JRF]
MKVSVNLFAFVLFISLCAFTAPDSIKQCYLSFKKASNLKAQPAERIPETTSKTRMLATKTGEVPITVTDGYRIIYNNKKKAPFVNLKVELSKPENYEQDKKNVLANLNYINSQSTGMESAGKLIELSYNGYKAYGLSRADISEGQTLGTFVIFPGDNTIIYLYFNNIEADKSHFKTATEYKGYRNDFIGQYTAHLAACK